MQILTGYKHNLVRRVDCVLHHSIQIQDNKVFFKNIFSRYRQMSADQQRWIISAKRAVASQLLHMVPDDT